MAGLRHRFSAPKKNSSITALAKTYKNAFSRSKVHHKHQTTQTTLNHILAENTYPDMSSLINKLKPSSHKEDKHEQEQEQSFHTQPHPAVRPSFRPAVI